MRILFISNELGGSGLCQKLIEEGNDLKLYIHRPEWQACYQGLAARVANWRHELNWVGKDGLIIFDDVFFGREQDELRKDGYKVVGGSEGGDVLELDRRHFQEVAAEYGMETLPSYNFGSADDAATFVRENRGRWVVKQSTHVSSLNFVGKSKKGTDVLRVLEQYKRRGIAPVHLQQYAQGIEVGVARYFNGRDWIGPIEINHEHKMLHDGDTGPLTPEMGTVIWYTDEEVRLFKETLDRIKPHLQEVDFRGDIDINCIVTKDHALPLEATPRFGNPSTELQVILHRSPWNEFLDSVACMKTYPLEYRAGYGVVVSLVVPPFPYEPDSSVLASKTACKIDFDHDSLTEEDFDHIHFEEVSKVDEHHYWTGKYGAVLYVTAHAETISEARQIAYKRIGHIRIPHMHYRKDIGIRVATRDIPKLKDWGWI